MRRITENPAQYEAVIQRSDVSGRYFELLKELCGLNWVPLFAQLAEQQDFTAEEIDYLETIIAKKRQERN